MDAGWVNLVYVLASILFISGLKGLTHPRTAVRGNLTSAVGMLLAVVVTLLANGLGYHYILLGFVVGALIGAVAATRVQMTQMPEM
ncbi:NAD(P)(+) transhydrogenase (Re/Si-specific) subunit beta, partial [bacterium]|nr:NAD(P)(+) transhydrogenase (Re/Si-specific) subunit beta [bacterium]